LHIIDRIFGGLPVPQVASDVQAYANTRPLPPARPAPAPDQAPVTPFASLLDDSTQGPPDNPPPPAADDITSRTDGPDQTQPPAQNTSNQAASANNDPQSSETKSGDAKAPDANSTDAKSANAQTTDNAPADKFAASNSFETTLGRKTGWA
jgi:hypothetical protein